VSDVLNDPQNYYRPYVSIFRSTSERFFCAFKQKTPSPRAALPWDFALRARQQNELGFLAYFAYFNWTKKVPSTVGNAEFPREDEDVRDKTPT